MKQNQSEQSSPELDSDMEQILELSYRKFKITMINI